MYVCVYKDSASISWMTFFLGRSFLVLSLITSVLPLKPA